MAAGHARAGRGHCRQRQEDAGWPRSYDSPMPIAIRPTAAPLMPRSSRPRHRGQRQACGRLGGGHDRLSSATRLVLSRRGTRPRLPSADRLGRRPDARTGLTDRRVLARPARVPKHSRVLHHSDRGIPYASDRFRALFAAHRIPRCMSRTETAGITRRSKASSAEH